MDETRLWTKNFIVGTLINFFLLLNYYLLMVVITDYSIKEYGASPSSAGLSASIFVIGALIARFFAGSLLEYIGRKKMLLLGATLELLMSGLYFIAGGLGVLFFIRILHGVSYGVSSTAIGTIVTDIIPHKRQGEGIGYYMLSVTLGAAIGPFFGMYLIGHGGFPLIFVTCTITAALCLLSAVILRVPAPIHAVPARKPAESRPGFSLHSFFEVKAIPISAVCAVVYFCYSSLLSFLTSYAEELQLQTAASFFFIVYAVAILVSRPFTGRLFDTRGERITMLPAFLGFLIGMVVLSQAHSGPVLLASAALIGFGVGVIQSCSLAIAVQSAPRERLSLVNSTFYIFLDAGVGIGPFVLGFVVPYTGFRGMYLSMAAVTLLCAVSYLFVSRSSARGASEECASKDAAIGTAAGSLNAGK